MATTKKTAAKIATPEDPFLAKGLALARKEAEATARQDAADIPVGSAPPAEQDASKTLLKKEGGQVAAAGPTLAEECEAFLLCVADFEAALAVVADFAPHRLGALKNAVAEKALNLLVRFGREGNDAHRWNLKCREAVGDRRQIEEMIDQRKAEIRQIMVDNGLSLAYINAVIMSDEKVRRLKFDASSCNSNQTMLEREWLAKDCTNAPGWPVRPRCRAILRARQICNLPEFMTGENTNQANIWFPGDRSQLTPPKVGKATAMQSTTAL